MSYKGHEGNLRKYRTSKKPVLYDWHPEGNKTLEAGKTVLPEGKVKREAWGLVKQLCIVDVTFIPWCIVVAEAVSLREAHPF